MDGGGGGGVASLVDSGPMRSSPRTPPSLSAAASLAVLLLIPAVPRAAVAEPARAEPRLRIATTGVVHAGDVIEIAFEGDVEEVREFEILMSLDGGHHYKMQITPELNAYTPRFFWRVPDVECPELRLKLRYHRDGREREASTDAALHVIARGDDPATWRTVPLAADAGETPRPLRRGESNPGGPQGAGADRERAVAEPTPRSDGVPVARPATPALRADAFRRPARVRATPLYTPPRN